MMVTAQGADHTTGNLPVFDCKDKTTAQIVAASLEIQTACAAADSLGLCIFGRSVTNVSAELIVTRSTTRHGTQLDASFLKTLGVRRCAWSGSSNKAAGFTGKGRRASGVFLQGSARARGKTARHHSTEVNRSLRELLA